MARPPVEWPIPVYVTELRERVVATYRVTPRLLAGRVATCVTPELARGKALVSLAFGNGRCLKGAGTVLASEFGLLEVTTPVRWQGACRAPLRGQYLLHLFTDSAGVRRLLRSALEFDADTAAPMQGGERGRYECRVEAPARSWKATLSLARPAREAPWGAASFSGAEEAEAALLHPEAYFVPARDGRVVRAAPVHQYARATTPVEPGSVTAPLLMELLGAAPGEVALDHVLFQKRCTHTWSFPPERIPVAARREVRAAVASGGWRLAA